MANDYQPARYRAGTRRTVAFSIIFGALGFILVTMLLSIVVDEGKNEAAKSAMSSVLPVCAGFIGSIMAFYFSDEGSDGNKDDEDVEQGLTSSRTIILMREGVSPIEYTFDANNLDGSKTMKDVMDEATSNSEDPAGASLLDPKEPEDGNDLFFSFTEKLRQKKLHSKDFNEMTLSDLSEKTSGSIVIEVSHENVNIGGVWENKTEPLF